MICRDIMKSNVECIGSNDTVKSAARKMRDANIGFLPVCDDGKTVIGTLTDRDIAIRVCAEDQNPSEVSVGEVMSKEVVSLGADEDLARAEELMSREHKSRMVVTDDRGNLAGVISLSDVAERDTEARAGVTLKHVAAREAPAHH
jgi:CBS domain-containing protein